MKEEPTPALLEIGDSKKKKSKFQKLVRLMTLEEGMMAIVEAVDYA